MKLCSKKNLKRKQKLKGNDKGWNLAKATSTKFEGKQWYEFVNKISKKRGGGG